jgi:hypothetical protein
MMKISQRIFWGRRDKTNDTPMIVKIRTRNQTDRLNGLIIDTSLIKLMGYRIRKTALSLMNIYRKSVI